MFVPCLASTNKKHVQHRVHRCWYSVLYKYTAARQIGIWRSRRGGMEGSQPINWRQPPLQAPPAEAPPRPQLQSSCPRVHSVPAGLREGPVRWTRWRQLTMGSAAVCLPPVSVSYSIFARHPSLAVDPAPQPTRAFHTTMTSAFSWYNRGPLTTTFTPPASCLSTTTSSVWSGSSTAVWVGHFNLAGDTSCYPPATKPVVTPVDGYYYSPAICPSGWYSACPITSLLGIGPVDPGTTAAACCPT